MRLHATTVAIRGRAVLMTGASGTGKSDLALRLIDRGAVLVSDDYTELTVIDGALFAKPPATIAGRMEVRGIGIVAAPFVADIPVALIVRLGGTVVRLPEDATATVAGVALPEVALDAVAASAPIKVEMALNRIKESR